MEGSCLPWFPKLLFGNNLFRNSASVPHRRRVRNGVSQSGRSQTGVWEPGEEEPEEIWNLKSFLDTLAAGRTIAGWALHPSSAPAPAAPHLLRDRSRPPLFRQSDRLPPAQSTQSDPAARPARARGPIALARSLRPFGDWGIWRVFPGPSASTFAITLRIIFTAASPAPPFGGHAQSNPSPSLAG